MFPGWSVMMTYACSKCGNVARRSEDANVERFFGPEHESRKKKGWTGPEQEELMDRAWKSKTADVSRTSAV